jgi:hypothetical protein
VPKDGGKLLKARGFRNIYPNYHRGCRVWRGEAEAANSQVVPESSEGVGGAKFSKYAFGTSVELSNRVF